MTTQKYKVGDEVLVRAKVTDLSCAENPAVIRINFKHGSEPWISREEIYSLAPEFDYGEEIEVSDDKIFWFKAKFLFTSIDTGYHCIVNGPFSSLYNYARKIQPKQEENILMFEGKKYKLVEE